MSRRARERGEKHDRWQDERDGDEDEAALPEPEEETPIHTNH